jgi:hypothetical protein
MDARRKAAPRVKKTAMLLRLPVTMWNAIVEAAKAEQMDVTNWVRQACRKALRVKGDAS